MYMCVGGMCHVYMCVEGYSDPVMYMCVEGLSFAPVSRVTCHVYMCLKCIGE